jgi:hypothetical protein
LDCAKKILAAGLEGELEKHFSDRADETCMRKTPQKPVGSIMPRLSPLPKRLRYLQPFRKKFVNRPPEELNEDSGAGPLFALLQKRMEGLSTAQAENLLKEDGAALQAWLSEPEQQNNCLHFALVFLPMIEPSELVAQISEHTRSLIEAQPFAEMDLPEGARLRKDKLIAFKKLLIALDVVSEKAASNFAEALGRRGPGDANVRIETFPVRFGQIVGTKFVSRGESWRGPNKGVCYILTAPGGHIFLSASPLGNRVDEANWDETELEASLHTLRVACKHSD